MSGRAAAIVGMIAITLLSAWGMRSVNEPSDRREPIPPLEAAGAAGEVLFSNVFTYSWPVVVMVVSPAAGGIDHVTNVVDQSWSRAGWATEVITRTNTATVTGRQGNAVYAIHLQSCREVPWICRTAYPDDDVFVHVWKVRESE